MEDGSKNTFIKKLVEGEEMTENLCNKMPREFELAHEHVEWFVDILKPLLISHFVHGYKHAIEDQKESKND